MATKPEIHVMWAMLVSNYPYVQREQTAAQLALRLNIYEELLADIPGDVLRAAAVAHIGANKFFPAISELRQAALATMAPARLPALEAWGEVVTARDRWCRYTDNGDSPLPEFSNPIIGRLVRTMGMIALQDSVNEPADRARFIEAYDQMCRREQDERMELPQVREVRERLQGDASRLAGLLGDTAAGMRLR